MATRSTKPKKKTESSRASRTRTATRGPDAIALLREDHKRVSAMFAQYQKMTDKSADAAKKRLVADICRELKVHTSIEEEIFYPAARAALNSKGDDLLNEAQVEHASAKELIAQLESARPGEDLYDAKVTVLAEYIKHHVKEEQEEMFPKCRSARMDLKGLGAQMQARKAQLA